MSKMVANKYMGYDNMKTELLLNRLYQKIEQTKHHDPYPGLIIASHRFCEPFALVNDIDLLSLTTMDLLIQFAYPSLDGYGKFTIIFEMKRSYGEVFTFTLGEAIPLTTQDCELIPMKEVYANISQYIQKYAENYDGDSIIRLIIRVYMDGQKKDRIDLSEKERESTLSEIIQGGLCEINPIRARKIGKKKHRGNPTHITGLKESCTELKP